MQSHFTGSRLRLFLTTLILCSASWTQAALPKPQFKLKDIGTEVTIDYEKYGRFEKAGSSEYQYIITDRAGLAKAAGTGIYPNNQSMFREDAYQQYFTFKKLEGNHWTFTGKNHELNFYKWTMTNEAPGVKFFNAAVNLERAGLIMHAIKAYHAIIVHFPKSIGYTAWKTPWYPAMAAADRLEFLLRKYPELGVEWQNGELYVVNAYDNNVQNDIVICNPGKLIQNKIAIKIKPDFDKEVVKKVGSGRVRLVQYKNGHWQMLVDNKPFMVHGIAYSPTPIGQSPEFGTLTDWMQNDADKNNIIDAPYEAWVDKNNNNVKDSNEKTVGDFQLFKEMGVNALRIYHHLDHPKAKPILEDLYKRYGVMTIMGDFVGMYARDSGATWQDGTDYRDPKQREKLMENIKKMVSDYKDEPFLLMWMLGNENVFGQACNADKFPKEYFQLINEIADYIHKEDPNHPVAICNGDLLFLTDLAQYAPNIDIIGANSYRGEDGFGKSFWRAIKMLTDKPAIVTEYGCPAYFKDEPQSFAEDWQARYHQGSWEDIAGNAYGYGYGNALGGIVFEWLDEWWKTMGYRDPSIHKTDIPWGGPFPDGFMYEEWLGLCAQGDGKNSPFLRQLRKSYFLYRDVLWKK